MLHAVFFRCVEQFVSSFAARSPPADVRGSLWASEEQPWEFFWDLFRTSSTNMIQDSNRFKIIIFLSVRFFRLRFVFGSHVPRSRALRTPMRTPSPEVPSKAKAGIKKGQLGTKKWVLAGFGLCLVFFIVILILVCAVSMLLPSKNL